MSDKPQENNEVVEPIVYTTLAIKALGSAAPQIFKRNGDVKNCPRRLQVKMGFKQKLEMYNLTKKAIRDNVKYGVEPKVTFCTSEFSVTVRGALAVLLTSEERDVLAEILDAGWSVC